MSYFVQSNIAVPGIRVKERGRANVPKGAGGQIFGCVLRAVGGAAFYGKLTGSTGFGIRGFSGNPCGQRVNPLPRQRNGKPIQGQRLRA